MCVVLCVGVGVLYVVYVLGFDYFYDVFVFWVDLFCGYVRFGVGG